MVKCCWVDVSGSPPEGYSDQAQINKVVLEKVAAESFMQILNHWATSSRVLLMIKEESWAVSNLTGVMMMRCYWLFQLVTTMIWSSSAMTQCKWGWPGQRDLHQAAWSCSVSHNEKFSMLSSIKKMKTCWLLWVILCGAGNSLSKYTVILMDGWHSSEEFCNSNWVETGYQVTWKQFIDCWLSILSYRLPLHH